MVRAEQGEATREDRPAQWHLQIVKSEGEMSFGLDGEARVRLASRWRVRPSTTEILERIPPLPPPMTPEDMLEFIQRLEEARRTQHEEATRARREAMEKLGVTPNGGG